MNNKNEMPENEKFSDDPEENLRMENEFLKMKMMAESGAIFGGDNLPPEIENEFLKNIMEFEKARANKKPQKIFDLIGKPSFEDEENLDDEGLEMEYKKLKDLLVSHGIYVDFLADRPDRFKYNFITKELFDHETDFIPVNGMKVNFSYEEFHPDHKGELAEITNIFINDFFERELNNEIYYISNELVEPEGNIITKEQLMKGFQLMYEVAVLFENTFFQIENIDFEIYPVDEGSSGIGYSDGTISYDIIFHNGDRKEIRGPFKIYFTRQWDCWYIYFFYLPGYNSDPNGNQEDS